MIRKQPSYNASVYASLPPEARSGKVKVGIIGGSFNPAHNGHVHISKEAKKLLGLDQIWWLVSPQNPLKSSDNKLSSLDKRVDFAKEVTAKYSKWLKILDFEKHLSSNYSFDTIKWLKSRCPTNSSFVWIMGADNLDQLPKWYRWEELIRTLPIAIFDRPGFTYKSLNGKSSSYMAKYRLSNSYRLATSPAPSWIFLPIRKVDISSTEIRQK